ncbi:unnamed protein product [Sphagnum balticum]
MSTMQTMQPLTNEQAYAKLRAYLKQLGYTEAAKELKFCYVQITTRCLGIGSITLRISSISGNMITMSNPDGKDSNKHLSYLIPSQTRCMRVDKPIDSTTWRVWLSTNDYEHGTYLELDNKTGAVTRITEREDGTIDRWEITPGIVGANNTNTKEG